ncbi:MAG: hypothetical protein U1E65_10135 [Myxococcota bacterium]
MKPSWSLVGVAGLLACDPSRPVRNYPDGSVACPVLSSVASVDSSCDEAPCRVTLAQTGCRVSMTLSGCKIAELSATLDSTGVLHPDLSSTLGVCHPAPSVPSGAVASLECEAEPRACRYDLYPSTSPLPIGIDHLKLVAALPSSPGSTDDDTLGNYSAHAGYLSDLLIHGTEVLVATHGGDYRSFDCSLGERQGTIVRVDRDQFTIRGTLSVPRCLYALAPDPLSDAGFLGIGGDQPLSIYRFDGAGSLVQTATLSLPANRKPYVPLAAAADRGALSVLYSDRDADAHSYVASIDPSTLRLLRFSTNLGAQTRGALLVDGGWWITDRKHGRLMSVDLASVGVGRVVPLSAQRQLADEPARIGALPGGRLVVTATGHWGGIFLLEPTIDGIGSVLGTSLFYDGTATPYGLTPLRAHPSSMLVALMRPGPAFTALLSIYSADEGRFLPGSVEAGFGPMRELVTDPEGRSFGLMPWAGELVRIQVPQ